MNAYSMIYMGKIIDNLYEDIEKKDKGIVFIKHYNNLKITEDDITGLMPSDDNVTVMYYEYVLSDIPDTYAPWLKWLKEIYETKYSLFMSIEDFVDKCEIYHPLKSVFISYIRDEKTLRYEPLIVREVEYESEQFIKSLIKSYEFVLKTYKFYFVINKIHMASDVTMRFLKQFIELNNFGNCSMIFTYNEVFTMRNEEQIYWSELLKKIESMNLVLDWSIHDEDGAEHNKAFIPIANKIDSYIDKINNMINTLSLSEAAYYLGIIYNKVLSNKIKLTIHQKYKIFSMYCYTCMCLNEHNMALHLCERMGALKKNDNYYKFNNLYLESMIYANIGQIVLAERRALECFEVAIRTKDTEKIFIGKLCMNVAKFCGWKVFAHMFNDAVIDDDFLEELEQRQFYNYLGYFYAYTYKHVSKEIIKGIPLDEPEYLIKAISYAEKIKNENLIIAAYTRCLTLASEKGYYDTVDYYYKKSLEILQRNGDIIEVAKVYNGLGYNRILCERFDMANAYLNKAVQVFYEEKMPENLSEILYNMSLNAFMAGDYKTSNYYMNSVLKILELLKIFRMRVCNMTKVYGIIAYCNLAIGLEYNSYMYLNLMERILGHLFNVESESQYAFWDDDLFLYYIVNASLKLKEGDLKSAKESFDRARYHLFRSEGFLQFGYYIYTFEMVKYYRYICEEYKALEAIDECIEYCNSKNFVKKINQLVELKKVPNPVIYFDKLTLDSVKMQDIFSVAEYKGVISDLRKKERDVHYITFWQELLNKEKFETEDDVIEVAIASLKSYYGIEKMLFIEVVDNEFVIKYQDDEFSDKLIKELFKRISLIGRDFVANRVSRTFDEYSDIIDLFDKSRIESLSNILSYKDKEITNMLIGYNTMNRNFANQLLPMEEEHLTVYKFLFTQLIEVIERIRVQQQAEKSNIKLNEVNQQLSQLAITDQLTGLLNRQGLNRTIQEELLKEFEMYGKEGKFVTVMYVDLDNFKYYNDRFGHDVGDKILITLSDTLKRLVGNDGYPVRYGGDEFIIILPYKKTIKAEEYAKCILSEIGSQAMFRKLGISDEEVDWAKRLKKVLSTSIGIAQTNDCSQKGIFDALKKADEALYDVKKNKKSGYRVWDSTLRSSY